MIAPDTNVLVRLLVVDDAAQARRAQKLFEQGDVLIFKTVLLETDGVVLEHEDACRIAIDAYARGLGFADAMHAATAATMSIDFRTFDRDLAGKPRKLVGTSVQPA